MVATVRLRVHRQSLQVVTRVHGLLWHKHEETMATDHRKQIDLLIIILSLNPHALLSQSTTRLQAAAMGQHLQNR